MGIRYFEKKQIAAPLYAVEFGHSLIAEEEKTIGPRVRDTFLLHLCTGGNGVFCGTPVARGDAFFISKNRLHAFTVSPGYEHFWIAFDGDGSPGLLSAFAVEPSDHSVFRVGELDILVTLIDRLFAQCDDSGASALAALSAILSYREKTTKKQEKKPHYATRAATYLADHFHKRTTMAELADYVCLSEKHLCRLFRREYGVPPQKYLLKIRMEKAAEMLETTDFSIKSIALSVGYPSQLSFSEMFRRFWGISPSDHRRKKRIENERTGKRAAF